jgi:hypothetical protein
MPVIPLRSPYFHVSLPHGAEGRIMGLHILKSRLSDQIWENKLIIKEYQN